MFASMKTAACTLVLGLTLMGFTLPAEAKKSQSPATSAPSTLTAFEQLCVTWGTLAFEQAQARDRGVSYLAIVQIMRERMDPRMAPLGLAILRAIYETPTLPPAIIRQQAELACTQRLEGILVAQ